MSITESEKMTDADEHYRENVEPHGQLYAKAWLKVKRTGSREDLKKFLEVRKEVKGIDYERRESVIRNRHRAQA